MPTLGVIGFNKAVKSPIVTPCSSLPGLTAHFMLLKYKVVNEIKFNTCGKNNLSNHLKNDVISSFFLIIYDTIKTIYDFKGTLYA